MDNFYSRRYRFQLLHSSQPFYAAFSLTAGMGWGFWVSTSGFYLLEGWAPTKAGGQSLAGIMFEGLVIYSNND